jgi:ssDNA-binding Zn-finger/Zn-ribbon topoisomerase 1
VLRQNRQTGALFTGCSAYPGCVFTEPHDSRVQTLSTGLLQAVQTQVVWAQAEAPAPGGRGAGGESAAAGR